MKNDKITVLLAINRMIIGGAEQQFLEIIKGIYKKRFNIIALTLFAGGDLEEELKSVPDIQYICLNRKSKYNVSNMFTIFQVIRRNKVDIIQPFLTPATFFTLIPAVIYRTPVKIVTERGSMRKSLPRGHRLYLRIEDFFTKYADRVIPNSKSGKAFLISRGIDPANIKVIYNGINLERLTPPPEEVTRTRNEMGIGDDEAVVGISASLFPLKDHATFLQAAQEINGVMPHVKFIILGDGPLLESLHDMAKDLGIAPHVLFPGNKTDVGPYLSNFDIACLCSKEPEGCSNSILEAMAMGKPVVATDAGGNQELVEDGKNGLIVPVQNPELLARAIVSLLKNPDLAREMGQHAREIIDSRFSLEGMVSEYESLYEEAFKAKISL